MGRVGGIGGGGCWRVHSILAVPLPTMIKRLLSALALLPLVAAPGRAAPVPRPSPLDTVVFAGGCFWGVQAVFQHVNGVVAATSGYAGGATVKPNYEDVSTGSTG